jgi:ubiquinone/menaquinone biosynthesis C-methylase UbiE/uncharacterized protein YbaR (Trm112 family)
MRQSLLAILQCPICAQPLAIQEVRAHGQSEAEIIEADLRCAACGTLYPVQRGMPNLLPVRILEAHKKQEMAGWVNLWQKKGMYDMPYPADHSLKLPYLGGIWSEIAAAFDLTMAELNLSGGEAVLDLGAGQGWASRYFAARGCKAFAIDIVADKLWGLGSAWAIMDYAGVYFEPMLADGENLPFRDGQFDIVFMSAALHHFNNIDRILQQAYRVLKPGGRIICAPEPSASLFVRERAIQNILEETQEGIVERRPKVYQYWWALRSAGFRNIGIDTFETHNASDQQIDAWIGGARDVFMKTVRPIFRPLVWAMYTLPRLLPSQPASFLVLCVNGGSILMRAQKSGPGVLESSIPKRVMRKSIEILQSTLLSGKLTWQLARLSLKEHKVPDDALFLRAVYRCYLKREPDEVGRAYFSAALARKSLTRRGLVDSIQQSSEFKLLHGLRVHPLDAMHQSRMWLVQNCLPAANSIVDLGGAAVGHQEGALLLLGYPYRPREIIIVDLPPPDRLHDGFGAEPAKSVTTADGVAVRYHYGSMADLSPVADGWADLVWSGESIEHVTEADADQVCQEAFRVLKTGGYFCLDTPNAALTRIQSPNELIHPEHKKEYYVPELIAKLEQWGFQVMEKKAIVPMPKSLQRRVFDYGELVENIGVGDEAEVGYMFYLKARKP